MVTTAKVQSTIGNESNTDNRDRFIRLASSRTQKALQAIDLLNNCINRSQYEYTGADWEKILNAISAEHTKLSENVRAAIEGKKAAPSGGFAL